MKCLCVQVCEPIPIDRLLYLPTVCSSIPIPQKSTYPKSIHYPHSTVLMHEPLPYSTTQRAFMDVSKDTYRYTYPTDRLIPRWTLPQMCAFTTQLHQKSVWVSLTTIPTFAFVGLRAICFCQGTLIPLNTNRV